MSMLAYDYNTIFGFTWSSRDFYFSCQGKTLISPKTKRSFVCIIRVFFILSFVQLIRTFYCLYWIYVKFHVLSFFYTLKWLVRLQLKLLVITYIQNLLNKLLIWGLAYAYITHKQPNAAQFAQIWVSHYAV